MKSIILFTILFFLLQISYSQDWLWSNNLSGDGVNEVINITNDASNNVYVIGRFDGILTHDLGTTTSFGNDDIFIAKYDSNGNMLWLKRIGSNAKDVISNIKISNSGDIFVTGAFQNDCKFETDTLTSFGSFDVFLAKYSSNGTYLWSKNICWGPNLQLSNNLDIDINNNIVVVGKYQTKAYFGVDTLGYVGNDTLTSVSTFDGYVAQYDNNGNLNWVKNISDKNFSISLNSVAALSDGYCIDITYKDSLWLDIDSLDAPGNLDVALYKTDFFGNGVWVRKISGTGSETSFSIEASSTDDIFICTKYSSPTLVIDSTDIELSLQTITNYGSNDILVSKYNNNGTLQWINTIGYSGDDAPNRITSLNNEVILSGQFADTLFFGADTLTSNGIGDIEAFFAVYDFSGNQLFAERVRGTNNQTDFSSGGIIDNEGNYIFAGNFKSDTLFVESKIDPLNIDTILNPVVGVSDIFLAKKGCQVVTMSFIVDTVDCAGDADGQIVIQPSQIENYTYTWTGGFADNDTITNVAEGWYYVTVTSPRGCMYTDSVEMVAMPPLQTIMDFDNITINCIGGNDGVGIVTPIDGVGPYTYTWSSSLSTDSTASDLTVGTHYVTVQDVCLVPVVDTITVDYMPTLYTTMSNHSIIVLCAASTNGEATVTANAGVGPFNYQWSSSANDTLPTNANLPVGLYYVTVTDVCNVETIDSVQVNYFPTMNASITSSEPASCLTTSDGEAYMFASSGVPPYDFIWDHGDTLANTTTLDTGWAYVTVSDFCISVVDSIYITYLPTMTIDITSYQDVSCTGFCDGEANVTVTNGVSPYFYSWSGSANANSSVNDLCVGWQYVTVTDYCVSLNDSVYIGTMPGLSLTTSMLSEASCINSTDGAAMVTAQYGALPYTYAWSNSASINTEAYDLPVGVQTVTVTDGCGSQTANVNITYTTPLSVTNTVTNLDCFGDTLGIIVLIPANGVLPYTYAWTEVSDTDSVAINLPNGVYHYTVTDFCGSVSDSAEILSPTALSASAIITNETFSGVGDGSVDLIVSGGTPFYVFTWSDGSFNEDLQNVTEGTYYFTITDDNQCELTDSVVIISDKKYIEIKNALTPNGDGVNDYWVIKYIESYPNCQVDVFNAWGMKVYSSTGYSDPWNGKKDNSGNLLPAASYYYIIDLKDGSEIFTGSVSIIK